MSSPTLERIMKHWTEPLEGDAGSVDLPFDVQAFCAEMDALTDENRRLADERDDWEAKCIALFWRGHADDATAEKVRKAAEKIKDLVRANLRNPSEDQ